MRENRVKQRLLVGDVSVGLMLLSADLHVAGIAAAAEFDFVMADQEHTSLSLRELEGLVRAGHAAGTTVLTRVPGGRKAEILAALETGVDGIMVPAIESAEQAQEAVDAARYAPAGRRGVYYLGYPSGYGRVPPLEHFDSANRRLLVILQIETAAGVERVEEIAAVEGVDCLLVGPGDLSTSLGVPWEIEHDRVWRAVRRTFAAAREHGRVAGIMPGSAAHAAACVEAGARLLLWGPDLALLRRAALEDVASLRLALPWQPLP